MAKIQVVTVVALRCLKTKAISSLVQSAKRTAEVAFFK